MIKASFDGGSSSFGRLQYLDAIPEENLCVQFYMGSLNEVRETNDPGRGRTKEREQASKPCGSDACSFHRH
jgi:hypothetical protein